MAKMSILLGNNFVTDVIRQTAQKEQICNESIEK
jgi:hypothetical protein